MDHRVELLWREPEGIRHGCARKRQQGGVVLGGGQRPAHLRARDRPAGGEIDVAPARAGRGLQAQQQVESAGELVGVDQRGVAGHPAQHRGKHRGASPAARAEDGDHLAARRVRRRCQRQRADAAQHVRGLRRQGKDVLARRGRGGVRHHGEHVRSPWLGV